MQEEKQSPLVLVYFKIRGKLQPIRNLCCYLGLTFQEVHLENEDTKKKLPEETKKTLKGLKVDKSLLPILVHENLVVYETLPIMNYICRRFRAEELLGSTLRQKARVTEFVELLLSRESAVVMDLFKMAEVCLTKKSCEIPKQKFAVYEKIIQIVQMLQGQADGRSFVFANVTLLDFLFLETCHLLLGMFNSINERKKCSLEDIFSGLFGGGNKNNNSQKYLKTIQNFVVFMYGQPFYRKNQQFLQSFTMICPTFPPHRVQGIRKIWGYNNNFVV